MKRTILIAGAALSLLGAAAIAQTTNETVTNPGTPTMQRAEDPANNAGLPGGVLPRTSTTPVPTGSTAASTTDQTTSPGANPASTTSAGSYGYDASATSSSDASSSSSSGGGMSGGASMAGERG